MLLYSLWNIFLFPLFWGNFTKKHAAALEFRHYGYLDDDTTDNVPDKISKEPIIIGNVSYEKTICGGVKGDCVIFETNGFHSGNRSHGKVRKSIVLTVDDKTLSFKNRFLEFLNTGRNF